MRTWTTRIPACLRRCGGGLPGDAHPGGEVGARRVTPRPASCALVAVVAHRRPREQHPRRAGEAGQRPSQQVGALGAAVEDELLARRGPLLVADAGTGEVHDRVDALEPGGVDGAGRGSQRTSSEPSGSSRTSRTTRWPSARSRGRSAEPIRP